MKSITPNQIKQNNRHLIYHYIYNKKSVSQQELSYDLHLSRPTVTTNLAALEEEGLITKSGQIDTEFVGRKASAYSIVPDFRVGIGVEIVNKEVKMIAVNLYGEKIDRLVYEIPYRNEDTYYKTVAEKILDFKTGLKLREEQILGIGFAMQGLITPDKQTVLYGRILSCTGLSINALGRYLPYPCSFIHDADSAAVSELWTSQGLENVFYLSLSRHLGAAIISDGKILSGKHGHTATIEHLQLDPHGSLCYCGKTGCMETLCSVSSLLSETENLDDFFDQLKEKEPSILGRWTAYLTNLAKAINILHLIYDADFILGGHLAPYFSENDIAFLHAQIQQMTPFPEEPDFIRISKMPKHNIAIGAALPYIQEFLS
ncbi:MAG: ROK family transcriptional regulator [Lachnospiraceae bacterium]|nr:ROK family transcriptional regulator [Lachnospiraceae bacterium]